ncbi:MAG: peptidase S15, partial [Phaeobacter gallaeciensis]
TLRLGDGDLTLPVAPTAGNEWTFPEPDSAEPWQTRQRRDPAHVRRVEQDQQTGLVSLVIEDDFGLVEDAEHGFFGGTIARERWVIHPDDPQSARGICHWTDERGRGDWVVRTETRSEMWSDATHFHLHASLEAFENGEQVFSKTFKDSIARDHL